MIQFTQMFKCLIQKCNLGKLDLDALTFGQEEFQVRALKICFGGKKATSFVNVYSFEILNTFELKFNLVI